MCQYQNSRRPSSHACWLCLTRSSPIMQTQNAAQGLMHFAKRELSSVVRNWQRSTSFRQDVDQQQDLAEFRNEQHTWLFLMVMYRLGHQGQKMDTNFRGHDRRRLRTPQRAPKQLNFKDSTFENPQECASLNRKGYIIGWLQNNHTVTLCSFDQ